MIAWHYVILSYNIMLSLWHNIISLCHYDINYYVIIHDVINYYDIIHYVIMTYDIYHITWHYMT